MSWSFDPSVIGGLAALCGLYWLYTRGPCSTSQIPNPRHDELFGLMIVLTLLALESPVDFLSDHYLFSVHMVQHLILILGVAPLLVITAPRTLVDAVRRHAPGRIRHVILQPALVFVVVTADLWAWHAPPLYEAALLHEPVHVVEHVSFVATACLFWWIALAPHGDPPALPVLARAGYVFAGAISNSLLGIILTFSGVLYPSYGRALDAPGLGRALELNLGLTPAVDQQLGGLVMWVPGGLVYLIMIIAIFISRPAGPRREPTQTVTVIYPLQPVDSVLA